MLDGTAAVALGAGMLAALNPCGFALLPAYLGLLVTHDDPGPAAAVRRALTATLAMTTGFLVVFAGFGLLVAPAASSAQRFLPWVTVVVGLVLVGAGAWVLAGRTLPTPGRRAGSGVAVTASLPSMFGFGVSYAAASLTCTIAPFLAVVVASFRAGSVSEGLLLFALYAAGMGLVVGTAALAVALARPSLLLRARRLGRGVPAVAGLLLVGVGLYVAYYGWWEIRVLAGAVTGDPVVGVAASVQQRLAGTVADLGPAGFLLVAAVVVALLLAIAVSRRRRPRSATAADPAPPRGGAGTDRRPT
ncbi:MAG: cytochrome c biogenesis protein CcdA [Nocardioidaceae bacterium]